jgi:glutamine synthetase
MAVAFLDPYAHLPTLGFICSLCEATGEEFASDSRLIVQKAVRLLGNTVDGESSAAPELEFYLSVIDPREREAIKLWFPQLKTHYHLQPPLDLFADVRAEMAATMAAAGIRVKYHHTEVGGTNDGTQQQEIEFSFGPIQETADGYYLARYIIDVIASKHGLTADFSPKPRLELAGSGFHTHFLISKDGRSLFYNNRPPYNLSKLALNFIAGILRHGRVLAAFTNPTADSYKRLGKCESPVALFWDLANRTAAIRIPGYARKPAIARFEYRPTDATGNYYLVLAAIIMAGIDGITNPPTRHGQQYYHPKYEGERFTLPKSVAEAAEALERDNEFLLRESVFPAAAIIQQVKNLKETTKPV